MGLFGMLGGPILGLYVLGMLYPWANKYVSIFHEFAKLIHTLRNASEIK